MKKEIMNYETLLKITRNVVSSRDPGEVASLIVESVKSNLEAKACALLLFNRSTHELEVAESTGLSEEYLNKGPLSSMRSIAGSLQDGPVAIYDVMDDPRIQYPDEARKEGISSILSVPIIMRKNPIGALRVYTSAPWEATLEEVNFVQAVAQIAGMSIEMSRLYKGFKHGIELLKTEREQERLKAIK